MGVKVKYVGAPEDGLRDGDVVEFNGKAHERGGDAVDHGDMDKEQFDRLQANPHFEVDGHPKRGPRTRKVELIEDPDGEA